MVPQATVPLEPPSRPRRCCAWSMPSMSRTTCRPCTPTSTSPTRSSRRWRPECRPTSGTPPRTSRFPAPTAPRRATATTRCRSSAEAGRARLLPGRQHAGLHPPAERLHAGHRPVHVARCPGAGDQPPVGGQPRRVLRRPGRLRLPAAGRHGEAGGQALRHPRPRRLLPALDLRGRRRRHDPPRPPGGRRPLVPPTSELVDAIKAAG